MGVLELFNGCMVPPVGTDGHTHRAPRIGQMPVGDADHCVPRADVVIGPYTRPTEAACIRTVKDAGPYGCCVYVLCQRGCQSGGAKPQERSVVGSGGIRNTPVIFGYFRSFESNRRMV